jgi:hypothetical protein
MVSRLTQSLQQNRLQLVPGGSVIGVEGEVFIQHLARVFFGGGTLLPQRSTWLAACVLRWTVTAASKRRSRKTVLLLAKVVSRRRTGRVSPNSIKSYQLRQIPGAEAI